VSDASRLNLGKQSTAERRKKRLKIDTLPDNSSLFSPPSATYLRVPKTEGTFYASNPEYFL